jgi:hypothetical protein
MSDSTTVTPTGGLKNITLIPHCCCRVQSEHLPVQLWPMTPQETSTGNIGLLLVAVEQVYGENDR